MSSRKHSSCSLNVSRRPRTPTRMPLTSRAAWPIALRSSTMRRDSDRPRATGFSIFVLRGGCPPRSLERQIGDAYRPPNGRCAACERPDRRVNRPRRPTTALGYSTRCDVAKDSLDHVDALVEAGEGNALVDTVHVLEVGGRGPIRAQAVDRDSSLAPGTGVGCRFIQRRRDDGAWVLGSDPTRERGVEIGPARGGGHPLALADALEHLGRGLVVAADDDLDLPVVDDAPQFPYGLLARDAGEQAHVYRCLGGARDPV